MGIFSRDQRVNPAGCNYSGQSRSISWPWCLYYCLTCNGVDCVCKRGTLIAWFMGPTWGPSGADRWAPCWPNEFNYLGRFVCHEKSFQYGGMASSANRYLYFFKAIWPIKSYVSLFCVHCHIFRWFSLKFVSWELKISQHWFRWWSNKWLASTLTNDNGVYWCIYISCSLNELIIHWWIMYRERLVIWGLCVRSRHQGQGQEITSHSYCGM